MPEPVDAVPLMLQQLQQSIADLRREMARRFQEVETQVDARFEKLEGRFDALRRAHEGESFLTRLAARDVDERMAELELRTLSIKELEAEVRAIRARI